MEQLDKDTPRVQEVTAEEKTDYRRVAEAILRAPKTVLFDLPIDAISRAVRTPLPFTEYPVKTVRFVRDRLCRLLPDKENK